MSVTRTSSGPALSVTRPGISRRPEARDPLGAALGRQRLNLVALWRGAELDRQLAAGIDPLTTGLLALRAERITRRRSRTCLANGLTRALRSTRTTPPGFTAAVAPQASEVAAASTVFAALDRCLRGPEPVSAQGVAILRLLLTDVASVLYQPAEPGALGSRLRAAAATLGHSERVN